MEAEILSMAGVGALGQAHHIISGFGTHGVGVGGMGMFLSGPLRSTMEMVRTEPETLPLGAKT